MEPTEIPEFSKQMGEAGEGGAEGSISLTRVSLAISILAVLVAMVTVLSHRMHTEAVLSQSRATDQWNEYQAKKIRFDNTSTALDLLSLQPSSNPAGVAAKQEEYRAHLHKWEEDLRHETEAAHALEEKVELAERKAARLDMGEALLQIGVVLCSITLFTRRAVYFVTGLTVGALGVLCALAALLVHMGS